MTSSLTTSRLLLREITETDRPFINAGLSDPKVTQYYGIHFDSLEATQEQMKWFADPQQAWWAVCSRGNNTFYGAGGLNNISNIHNKAEIGFWLLPEYWGRGIMAEAFPLICDYGFETLNLHRIEGMVETHNHNCKKAMEKLDFQFEGTMRECEIKNGKRISLDMYAKLFK